MGEKSFLPAEVPAKFRRWNRKKCWKRNRFFVAERIRSHGMEASSAK